MVKPENHPFKNTTKFMLVIGVEMDKVLEQEAKRRDVGKQELIRVVILPYWAREHGLIADPRLGHSQRRGIPSIGRKDET